MDTPAFDATRFVWPTLLTIALYALVIVISLMTMVKPAQAAGTVSPSFTFCLWVSLNPWARPACGFDSAVAACAAVGETAQTNGSCQSGYYYWTASSTSTCPANSTGTPASNPTSCTCNDPSVTDPTAYVPDPNGTSCVPAAVCPVDKLTTPPFDDACSTSLEKGKGVDVNNACGGLTSDMAKAASCIADKIHALNIPYTQPSATIRTVAYQNHLLEIWDKSQRLNTIMNSVVFLPEIKQACAPINADINNEKSAHGITHQPSSSGDAAPHVEHRAIDVPEAVAKALMDQVTTYTTTVTTVNGQNVSTQAVASDVEDYMHSATVNPPACDSNISWGGRFDSYDYVHFQLPKLP